MTEPEQFNLTVRRRSTLATLGLATGFVVAMLVGILVVFVLLQALGLGPDVALLVTLALALLALGFGIVGLASSATAPCRFVLRPDGIHQTFTRTGKTTLIPWDAVVKVKTERHTSDGGTDYDELTVQVREGAGQDIVLQERPSDGAQIAAFRRFRDAVLEGRHAAMERERSPQG